MASESTLHLRELALAYRRAADGPDGDHEHAAAAALADAVLSGELVLPYGIKSASGSPGSPDLHLHDLAVELVSGWRMVPTVEGDAVGYLVTAPNGHEDRVRLHASVSDAGTPAVEVSRESAAWRSHAPLWSDTLDELLDGPPEIRDVTVNLTAHETRRYRLQVPAGLAGDERDEWIAEQIRGGEVDPESSRVHHEDVDVVGDTATGGERCDECSAVVPSVGRLVDSSHLRSCSLHPQNLRDPRA